MTVTRNHTRARLSRHDVQLPCSSPTRRGRTYSYAKLLHHVDPQASSGFGFEGILLKPGLYVAENALWPTPEYPSTPILLEYVDVHGMGPSEPSEYQRKHNQKLYVLWRFDPDSREWIELARAVDEGWAMILRPAAIAALAACRRPVVPITHDLPAISARIGSLLDKELAVLEPDAQDQVLNVLHTHFAIRGAR